jgi:hypothetical protein
VRRRGETRHRDESIDGETVLKSIAHAAATPRDVIARYNALVGADKN